jgi:TolA-binding protein
MQNRKVYKSQENLFLSGECGRAATDGGKLTSTLSSIKWYKKNMTAEALKKKFGSIRRELEEHLNAINENTSEIQGMFDYLQEMEGKIEKLSQRLDQLQLNENNKERQEVIPLNRVEKKLFLVLYTEDVPLSYGELGVKAEVPVAAVPDFVSSLGAKGIPLKRSVVNNQMFISLDKQFKERQAKENLINLSLESFMD